MRSASELIHGRAEEEETPGRRTRPIQNEHHSQDEVFKDMSTKIEGIFSHDLTSYDLVEHLPERLRPTLPSLLALSYWRALSPACSVDPAWHIGLWGRPTSGLTPRQQWQIGAGPMLFAPANTPVDSFGWLVLGRRSLFATTGVKWGYAMDRPASFQEVRGYFRCLALALNSGGFILYRENGCLSWDWVLQGMTLDEIERELASRGAKRAASLDDLSRSGPKYAETNYYRE
jgi:hypothetical protein